MYYHDSYKGLHCLLSEVPSGNANLITSLNKKLLRSVEDELEEPNPSVYLGLRLSSTHSLSLELEYLAKLQTTLEPSLKSSLSEHKPQPITGLLALHALALRAACADPITATLNDKTVLQHLKQQLHHEKEHIATLRAACADPITATLNDKTVLQHLKQQLHHEKEHIANSNRPLTNYYQYSLGVLSLCVNGVRLNPHVIHKLTEAQKHSAFLHKDSASVDTEAMAGLAFQCLTDSAELYDARLNEHVQHALGAVKAELVKAQDEKGLIGNVFSTPLAVQALLAMNSAAAQCSTAVETLVTEMSLGTFHNPMAISQLLPVLHQKTYLDISKMDCTGEDDSLMLEPRPPAGDLPPEKVMVRVVVESSEAGPAIYTGRVRVPKGSSLHDALKEMQRQKPQEFTLVLEPRPPAGDLPPEKVMVRVVVESSEGGPAIYTGRVRVPKGSSLHDALKEMHRQKPQEFSFETVDSLWGPYLTTVLGMMTQQANQTYWQLIKSPDTPLIEAVIIDYGLIKLRFVKQRGSDCDLSANAKFKIFMLSLTFCASIAFGNIGLNYVQLSFAQMIYTTTPLFTLAISTLVLGKQHHILKYTAMMPICLGASFSIMGEVQFHPKGCFFVCAATMLRGVKSIQQTIIIDYGLIKLRFMKQRGSDCDLSANAKFKIFMLSLTFCASIAFGNIGLNYVQLSFAQMIYTTTPLFTLAISTLVLGKQHHILKYTAMMPICLGASFSIMGEEQFHPKGCFFVCAATMLRGVKSIQQSILLQEEKINSVFLLYLMAIPSFCILFIATLALENWAVLEAPIKYDNRLWVFILLSCLGSVLYNLASFCVLTLTSAVTLHILGNLNVVGNLLLSQFLFGSELSALSCAGVVLTLSGIVLYQNTDYIAEYLDSRKTPSERCHLPVHEK
ncbi:UNVERIFIED_CONTAM: hypothetical protein FKN15_078282 [Acipenser sinensis]